MAITKILGVSHAPEGFVGNAASCYGLAYTGLDPVAVWSTYTACLRIQGDKMILGKNPDANQAVAGTITIPFASLIGGSTVKPNKVTVGFRHERLIPTAAAHQIFAIRGDRIHNTPYEGIQSFVAHIADQAGSYYYEVVLDFVDRSYTVWMDGTLITPRTALSASITKDNIGTLFWQIGTVAIAYLPQAALDNPISTFADVYCTIDTGDVNDPYPGRLGPISVVRLPVLSDGNSPWPTSNSASVTSVLNTRRQLGAALSAPYAGNDVAKTPLVLKLDTSAIPAGVTLAGMELATTPFRDASAGTALNISLKYNADVQSLLNITPVVTNVGNDTRLGLVTKLPGNGTLSKANVAAAELVFTPT